jgi:hypothetical protein
MSEISPILHRLRTASRPQRKNHGDRAAAVATAILQIVDTASTYTVCQQIENYLRDEIADLENQIIAERELSDV